MADGGATVLQATAPELLPELVLGDLDSARPEVLQSYRDRPDAAHAGRLNRHVLEVSCC